MKSAYAESSVYSGSVLLSVSDGRCRVRLSVRSFLKNGDMYEQRS